MALLRPPARSEPPHPLGGLSWGDSLLDFWDDLTDDGRLEERERGRASDRLAGRDGGGARGGETDVTYLLTWNFPNRRAWSGPGPRGRGEYGDAVIGNAYSVALPRLLADRHPVAERLGERTRDARRGSCGGRSDAPGAVDEAALFNLSTLRSPTVLPDRRRRVLRLGGGRRPHRQLLRHVHARVELRAGHVVAVRARRPVVPDGRVRPLHRRAGPDELPGRAAAGATRATGDSRPRTARWAVWCSSTATGSSAAIDDAAACAVAGGPAGAGVLLDPRRLGRRPGRRDGGRASTTRWTSSTTAPTRRWGRGTSAALRAARGDGARPRRPDFADRCRRLFENGAAWMDANLFNGEYYRHEIRPPPIPARSPRPAARSMGSADTVDPDLQLGDGCLVDQLVGQYAADADGLGAPASTPTTSRRPCATVHRRNFRRGFARPLQPMRSFVLGRRGGRADGSYDATGVRCGRSRTSAR